MGPRGDAGFLELGLYISFSGNVTFPKATDTHAMPKRSQQTASSSRQLPVLGPRAATGEAQRALYVMAVAERVAELRQEPLQTVALQSTQNACALFGPALHNV